MASHGLCWAHAPENAERRQRAASRAARSKPNGEIRDLKHEVRDLIAAVKDGSQNRNDAAVMLQGYRVLREYLELERRIAEDDVRGEFEELKRDLGVA